MDTQMIEVTTGHTLVTDITRQARDYAQGRGDGLLHVFVPHATAGVALMETNAGSEPDLEETLARILPRQDIYQHRHGSVGHGRDHVLPAIVSPSTTIPVTAGELMLGVWQSLVLIDPNGDNPQRGVRLSFLAG